MSHYRITGTEHLNCRTLDSSTIGQRLQNLAAAACNAGVYLHVQKNGEQVQLALSTDWLDEAGSVLWTSPCFPRTCSQRHNGDLDRAITKAMLRIAALSVREAA